MYNTEKVTGMQVRHIPTLYTTINPKSQLALVVKSISNIIEAMTFIRMNSGGKQREEIVTE